MYLNFELYTSQCSGIPLIKCHFECKIKSKSLKLLNVFLVFSLSFHFKGIVNVQYICEAASSQKSKDMSKVSE